jgi:hypothetical protein
MNDPSIYPFSSWEIYYKYLGDHAYYRWDEHE